MEKKESIPTNLRTIRILEVLAAGGRAMTPTEVNAELGLPKQRVHRICQTLLDEGLLVRDEGSKRLRPGRRMRKMASGILHGNSIHIARRQILQQVADAVRETVNFVVPEPQGMTYRDRVETDWAFRIQLPIGSHVPFHCTASGKTYLASLPPRERSSLVGCLNLEKLTPNTLDTPKALLDELEKVDDQGYSIDNEEFMEGMIAAAVPIRDNKGRYFASIAFHGPKQRLTIDAAIAGRSVLFSAAKALSAACFSDEM